MFFIFLLQNNFMKKIPLLIGVVFFLLYKLIQNITGDPWLSLLVFALPIGILVTSFILRRQMRFKKWFLSPMNVFFEQKTNNYKSDIPSDLLLNKLTEMLEESDFKVFDTNEQELNILCGTSPNFWTWGENIYIQIDSKTPDESVISFTSVTLFGNTSWGRNQKNYELFISSFEDSLTI